MLVLRKNKKTTLLMTGALALAVSVLSFAVSRSMIIGDSYADTMETYTMPSGFNDQVFYDCIVNTFKTEFKDEEIHTTGLTDEQLARITSLDCGAILSEMDKITDATGIEKLTGLTTLDLHDNNISNIDLSSNVGLTNLILSDNNLGNIDVSANVNLVKLDVGDNNLSSIDVSHNLLLKALDVRDNININYVDVDANTLLEELYVNGCSFEEIDVSAHSILKKLDVSENSLTSLDLSNNPELTTLWGTSSMLTNIVFPENSELREVFLYGNELTSIDLDNLTKLQWINLSRNKLTELSVDKNIELTKLMLGGANAGMHNRTGGGSTGAGNKLTSIDVSKNTKLKHLILSNNEIVGTVDVSHNPELMELAVNNNELTSLDVTSNPALTTIIADTNHLPSLDVTNNPLLRTLAIIRNDISEIDLSKNTELYNLTIDNILIDLGLVSMDEEEDIYNLKDINLLKEGWRYIFTSISGGDALGNLSFDINDTDDYSYDKESGILTVMNPEAIDDGVPVVAYRPFGTQLSACMRFSLKLPAGEVVVPDVVPQEEIVDVPEIVVQKEKDVAVPDTGENDSSLDSSLLVIAPCGAVSLIVISFAAMMIIRYRRKKNRMLGIF